MSVWKRNETTWQNSKSIACHRKCPNVFISALANTTELKPTYSITSDSSKGWRNYDFKGNIYVNSVEIVMATEGRETKVLKFLIYLSVDEQLCKTTTATAKEWKNRITFDIFKVKRTTDLIRTILTRLRQKGNPWAMMLMLNILSTFWGGNGSVAASLGSARWSAWFSSRACEVFPFPQETFGIFLRAPDDEKRGIGQCRSIAKDGRSKDHIPDGRSKTWPTSVVSGLLVFTSKQRLASTLEPWCGRINAPLPEPLHLPTQNSSPCWLAPFKISLGCEVTAATKPGRAAAVREDGPTQPPPHLLLLSDRHCGICSYDPLAGGMRTSSRPTQHTCPESFLIVVILWPLSGPPNLEAYIITKPRWLPLPSPPTTTMKTVRIQQNNRSLYPHLNPICQQHACWS